MRSFNTKAVLFATLLGCGGAAATSATVDASMDVGSQPVSSGSACTPGLTQECVGPGACVGGQACDADGNGFGPCVCSSVVDSGGSIVSDSGPWDGVADTSSGPLDGAAPSDAALGGAYDMCTLTPNIMIAQPAMLTYTTSSTGNTATISGMGSALTLAIGGDSGINCSLALVGAGDMATVGMQTCDATIDGIAVVITFESGAVLSTVAGLRMTSSVVVTGVDGGPALSGSGSLEANCTKM